MTTKQRVMAVISTTGSGCVMEMQDIYKKIKVMRIFKGWSQEEAAERMGMALSSYAKIERGETDVNLSRLAQIAETMDIDLMQLLALNNGNAIRILENSTNHHSIGIATNHNIFLTETQCAHELQKANLLLQERENENALLKKQIAQLEKLVAMLEKDKQP